MKGHDYIAYLLVIILGIFFYLFVQETLSVDHVTIKNITKDNIIVEVVSQITEIKSIAKEVSNEFVYTNNTFNCRDFSRALKNRLEQLNYTVNYCIGIGAWCNLTTSNNGCLHGWVEVILKDDIVPIESMHGKILTPEEYKRDYLNKSCS